MHAPQGHPAAQPSRPKHAIHAAPADPTHQRLQKVLAGAGIDSRRQCEALILSGVVEVNGQVVDSLPAFVDPARDRIAVRGQVVRPATKVYFLLNKPKRVICTNADPLGRRRATDLVDCRQRVFCVGRLDAESTGAILLTNDSELANRLTHPRYEIAKTYQVTVRGQVEGASIEDLKKGVWLAEGRTGKAAVKVLHRSRRETRLQITITQGLNRQVRRVLARLGYKVTSLKRTQIGPLSVKGLAVGAWRPLSAREVDALRRQAGLRRGTGLPPQRRSAGPS